MQGTPFTKALLLILTLGFVGVLVPASSAEEPAVLAGRLVEMLRREDFAGPVKQFDDAMRKALTPEALRDSWRGVLLQMGKFKRAEFDRLQKVDRYDVVVIACQFEKGILETQVTFDREKRVAGLRFLPPKTGAASNPPPYALVDRFKEVPVVVGSGPWVLPGTLALPVGSGSWPAVVLVHGSGPQDRDETVSGCKPFRDLAQGLAGRGIAVLRYDKRTFVHAKKILENPTAFTVREEVVDDAVAAVSLLTRTPGIDPRRIYLLAHSTGGYLVPRIARADGRIAGFILMAALARPLEESSVRQMRYLASLQTPPSEALRKALDEMARTSAQIRALQPADRTATQPWLLGSLPAYWLDLRGYKPDEEIAAVRKPILALQGGRDYQVTAADFALWKTGLSRRTDVRFIDYPMLNHLFVAGQGSSVPEEYARPGNVAEAVVKDIAGFILGKSGQ